MQSKVIVDIPWLSVHKKCEKDVIKLLVNFDSSFTYFSFVRLTSTKWRKKDVLSCFINIKPFCLTSTKERKGNVLKTIIIHVVNQKCLLFLPSQHDINSNKYTDNNDNGSHNDHNPNDTRYFPRR